jgi:hypothetical protein
MTAPAQIIPLAGRYDHEALVRHVLELRVDVGAATRRAEAAEARLFMMTGVAERRLYGILAAALGGFLVGIAL